MKTKLSNSATDLNRMQIYALYLLDIAIIVVITILIIRNEPIAALFLTGILVVFIVLTLFVRDYCSKLCEAYIDDEYLYLEKGKLIDKTELSNIKTLKYHPLFIRFVTEGIITVRFHKETLLGSKIYIYPTSLNKDKEYKLNRHILNLIAEKVNYYNKQIQ